MALGERIFSAVLVLSAFAVSSGPIREAYDETGTPSHDVLMGLDVGHELQLGLELASYSRVDSFRDCYVLAGTTCYARRVHGRRDVIGNSTYAYEESGRLRLLDIARQFPADMLTRFYAAISQTLGNVGNTGLLMLPDEARRARFFRTLVPFREVLGAALWRCRFLFVAVVLMAIAVDGVWRGLLVLSLVLYFGGYPCLLYEVRHIFHLCFVPLLFAGCVFDRLGLALRVLPRAVRDGVHGGTFPIFAPWRSPRVRRVLWVAAGTAVIMLLPLYGLRAYQTHAMGRLLDQYANAELEPLETEVHYAGDWACFRPTGRLASQAAAFFDYTGGSGLMTSSGFGDYLVAEFEAVPEARAFRLSYDSGGFITDFSSLEHVRPLGKRGGGVWRFFFPVYEYHGAYMFECWNRFAGVAVPREHAGEFKGLYRVRSQREFRLWLGLWLPADRRFFRACQHLRGGEASGEPPWRSQLPMPPSSWGFELDAYDYGNPEKAEAVAATLRHMLEQEPTALSFHMALAKVLQRSGRRQTAIEAYRTVIGLDPLFFKAYDELDALVGEAEGIPGRIAEWQRVAAEGDRGGHAHFCLARALADQGNRAEALKAYREAARRNPGAPAAPWAIGRVFASQGKWVAALAAYERAMRLSPFDFPLLEMAIATARSAQEDSPESGLLSSSTREHVIEFYRKAIDLVPAAFAPYESIYAFLSEHVPIEERVAEWQRIVERLPKSPYAYFYLGLTHQESGDIDAAIDAYRKSAALEPSGWFTHRFLGLLFVRKGEYEAAIEPLNTALAAHPEFDDARLALVEALVETGQQDAARAQVRVCRERGIPVPHELARRLGST